MVTFTRHIDGETIEPEHINEIQQAVEDMQLPTGGTTGQALVKSSNTNYATQWSTISSGGSLPTGARANILRHDGTNWYAGKDHYVDIRDFGGADPSGLTNSAPAINTALSQAALGNGGGALPLVLGNGANRAVYAITESIVMPQGTSLIGNGQRGYGTEIRMEANGTNDDVHAITTANDPRSGFRISALRLVDNRTNMSRLGCGIYMYRARDYVIVEDCMVQKFYDNYYFGSPVAGEVGDRGALLRCWSVNPINYGVHLQRVSQGFTIQSHWTDTALSTITAGVNKAVAAIRVEGSGPVGISDVSHENADGAHLLVTNGSPVTASNLYRYIGPAQGNPQGDMVRIEIGYGTGTVLTNVSVDTNVYAKADNLLNMVEPGWTIPGSDRRIEQWVGWGVNNSPFPATIRLGKAKQFFFEATPEALVSAAPGSVAYRSSGSLYLKTSGTGNTGWVRLDPMMGSKTFDWPSVASGAQSSTTVTVTGARLGHQCQAAMSVAVPAGVILGAQVTANDTVTVTLLNMSGSAVDLASGTLSVRVTEK